MNEYEQILEDVIIHNNIVLMYKDIDKVSKEDFAKIRHCGFGASDSSRLLDINPFSSKQELINEKIAYKNDESISKKASVRMGADLEPLILSKAEELLKAMSGKELKVYKPKNMYGDLTTHLNINYDGVLFEDATIVTVVEAKAVTKYGKAYYTLNKAYARTQDGIPVLETVDIKRPEIPKITELNYVKMCHDLAAYYGIPIYYFTQVQQQLMSLNVDYGYLVILDVDCWETYIFKVYKYQDIIDLLKIRGIKNWAFIEARRAVLKARSDSSSEKTNDEIPTK